VQPTTDRERDALLMAQIAQGSATAYRDLSATYLDAVLNYCNRLVKNQADAEEITQEAFVRLWKAAPGWQPKATAKTWLFTVAHNLCLDRLRSARRNTGNTGELQDEAASDSVRPSRRLDQLQQANAVRAALEQLPDRQRHALLLSHYDGLSNAEIGDVLGVGVEAVESLLSRARRTLRTLLAPPEPV
jgi:RNA polymerase sigma-70 factor (ECF subfamily)